jgi:signal transduction histidine kinase
MPPDLIHSLYRISSLVSAEKKTPEALEVVLEEVLAQTGADTGSITLIDPNTDRLQIEVQRGMPADYGEAPLRVGEGITGWVALHGKPLVAPDVSKEPRYRKIMSDVRSEMAAPIEDRGQVIGVINVNSPHLDGCNYDKLYVLTHIAAETATLLRQLWLVDSLKTTTGHLKAVLTVGEGIVARLDQREILHIITRQTATISGCRLCAIHLLSDDGNRLLPQSTAGCAGLRDHPALPVGETSAGVAVQRRKQMEISDILTTEEEGALLEFAQGEDLVSLLCTPIVFENRVLGTLSAYTGRTHRFSNDERNLFETMAGLGAVAIHNAQLYQRVFQTEESLRRREKLTTLGLIAAEIAHEIRNPLTVLQLLFQALDLKFPPEDARAKDVKIIGEKLDQLEGTVGRVLTFARPAEEPHALWHLDELIADTAQLMRLKCQQAGVQIIHQPNPKTPPVPVDKGQIQQVLLNLLLNSLQAVEREGRIELRTGPEIRDRLLGAFIEIEDNGLGIPGGPSSDIFQALLTGHPEGTGLGLGIVKRIVESHGGKIEIARTGPDGTVMKVWLPSEES